MINTAFADPLNGRGARNRTPQQLRDAFLNSKVRRDNGHLIWQDKLSALSGEPVGYQGGDSLVPGYVIAYKILLGKRVSGLVQTCGVKLCVEPTHWRKAVVVKAKPQSKPQKPVKKREPKRPLVNGQKIGAHRPGATDCIRGHSKAEHWRVLPSGPGYCAKCKSESDAKRRPSKLAKRPAAKKREGYCHRGYGEHLLTESGKVDINGRTYCYECVSTKNRKPMEMCGAGLHLMAENRRGSGKSARCGKCHAKRQREARARKREQKSD